MDVGLALHQRLGAVTVVHIPIDDQHALEPVLLARVMRSDRDVSEEAESHCAIIDCVVSGWSHRRKAAWMNAADREIDRGQDATGARSCRFPRAAALDGVGIESAAALLGEHSHRAHVRGVMRELEFLHSGVATFDVLDTMKQLRVFAKCASDGAQAADVLGVAPACVVPAAVTV